MKKIHFIGIGGDGIAGTAYLAYKRDFEISGCDNGSWGKNYDGPLVSEGIRVDDKHDVNHLKGIDLVVCSNAMFYEKNPPNEFVQARERKILLRWTNFLAKYIIKDNNSVFICGSHGKTTTTTLISKIFELAKLDPNVTLGETVREWGRNFRSGNSDLFVVECDEKFFDDFEPVNLVLNNMDYEHPEYFENEDVFQKAYESFILRIREKGIIVFNYDDKRILKTIVDNLDTFIKRKVRIIAYSIASPFCKEGQLSRKILFYSGSFKSEIEKTHLEINKRIRFVSDLRGEHNVMNMLAAYAMCKEFSITDQTIERIFSTIKPLRRRIELIYKGGGISVYDDFAHHPTEVFYTLRTLRASHKNANIIAVFEPHQITRLLRFWNNFLKSLNQADRVILLPIYIGREQEKEVPDLARMVRLISIGKNKFSFSQGLDQLLNEVLASVVPDKADNVIVIMGAGKSNKVAQEIKDLFAGRN